MIASAIVKGTSRIRANVCANKRLAAASGADQQDVGFSHFNIAARPLSMIQKLVVVVYRDRQHTLGRRLTDHIIVQHPSQISLGHYLVQRKNAEFNTLIADEHSRTRDQLTPRWLFPQKLMTLTECACNRVLVKRSIHPGAVLDDFIDVTPVFCLFRAHEILTIKRLFNRLYYLPGMTYIDIIQAILQLLYLCRVNHDIDGLAPISAALYYPAVGQKTLKGIKMSENSKFSTRLGLDIGTNSIGWWLYRTDGNCITEVIDGGVRIFSDGRKSGPPAKISPIGNVNEATVRQLYRAETIIIYLAQREKETPPRRTTFRFGAIKCLLTTRPQVLYH